MSLRSIRKRGHFGTVFVRPEPLVALLREVDSALERMQAGTFGICEKEVPQPFWGTRKGGTLPTVEEESRLMLLSYAPSIRLGILLLHPAPLQAYSISVPLILYN